MECFIVYRNEIEGRFDPFYYRLDFRELENRIKKSKYRFVKFKDIIDEISGGATPKIEKNFYTDEQNGVPFLRVQNVTEEGIKLEDVKFIKKEVHEKMLKRSQLHENELVFTITGRIGNVAVVPKGFIGNINQHSVRIKLKEKIKNIKVLPEFIAIYFNLNIGLTLSFRKTTGGTRPALDYEAIKNLIFPLPTFETQQKIVSKIKQAYKLKKQKETEAQQLLDSINDYILSELGIKLPELKEQMTFVVYADDVKGGRLDPFYYRPEFREFEKKIKSSLFVEFKEIILEITKGETPLWRGDFYQKEGIPFLKVQNISEEGIKGELTYISKKVHKRMKRSQLRGGEILYTMAGSIGIATIFPKNFGEANINQAIAKIIVKENINKKYLVVLLNSNICKKQSERYLTTSAQPNINFEQIKSLKIPLPPLEIQNKIAEEVKRRMQKAEQLQKEAKEVLEKAKQEVENIILNGGDCEH